MKMDSLSSGVNGPPMTPSGIGGGKSSRESILSGGIYESAHFTNIFVEFENDDREMAVDVPDHFVATTKTPPKYPPPLSSGHSYGGTAAVCDSRDLSNGQSPLVAWGSSHELPSRQHLKIEKDGRLRNCLEGPPLPPSGVATPAPSSKGPQVPTPEQSLRMKKYGAGAVKRAIEEEKRQAENELLRRSVRNSQKMRALAQTSFGTVNPAFSRDGSDDSKTSNRPDLAASIRVLSSAVSRLCDDSALNSLIGDAGQHLSLLRNLFHDQVFQASYEFARKAQTVLYKMSLASVLPSQDDALDLAGECADHLSRIPQGGLEVEELRKLLSGARLEGLLCAHDQLARRYLNRLDSSSDALAADCFLERLSYYSEPNIKIVRIEKTSEPLGATVKNEDDAVVVGRIIRGGTAEASGLLHEGDEILEVNEVELRGKDVNEVCDILSRMQGTLTFLVIPSRRHLGSLTEQKKYPVMHVKTHIDYDPEDDLYVPCRELGVSFQKGDILHVVNQQDPHWWQARRDGEEDLTLPGLIPSASFLQQREAMKHTIALDVGKKEGRGVSKGRWSGGSGRNAGFLCAKKSGKRKRRHHNKSSNNSSMADTDGGDSETENIITYEEVALYYPRAERKRPVVLIGPPNIGRHELRQRLMLDQERFAAAIPHTSRPRRANEVDGQDYHFISRLQFEQDIIARKFVEHGEYEKAYYGTSLEAIRSVVFLEKICVLNLHPQSLRMLKSSDLMPYVVFVGPPSLEKLKRWKIDHSEPINDVELKDIIERAREMEDSYGHYFDMFITYSDPERAYQQLLSAVNALEREPQWVPASWLTNKPTV